MQFASLQTLLSHQIYHIINTFFRLFGFKISPMAYQIQERAAAQRGRSASARPRSTKPHYK